MYETAAHIIFTLFSIIITILIIPAVVIRNRKDKMKNEEGRDHIILIPFRNEEKNLPRLLESIDKHISEETPIYFIDDSSEDRSAVLVEHFIQGKANRYLLTNENEDKTISPKQAALAHAIGKTESKNFAVVDADCEITENWEKRISEDRSDFSIAYGYSKINPDQIKGYGLIEAIELFFLFTVSFGFSYFGVPSSCMGNNLFINRQAYSKAGGFTRMGKAYNEDLIILKIFRRMFGSGSVFPMTDAVMLTSPMNNFADAVSQKVRWLIDGIKVYPYFLLVLIFFLSASISLWIIAPALKLLFVLLFLIYILSWSKKLNERISLIKLVLMNILIYLLPILYLIGAFILVRRGLSWKGRMLFWN